jgi:hypothetical protein
MTLKSGRGSATKTPTLVVLVAETKGATSDRLKRLKKLWFCATKVTTKVSTGRLVFLSLPLEGKDDDRRPRPLADQFLLGSSTLAKHAWPSTMPALLADILERRFERREKDGSARALPRAGHTPRLTRRASKTGEPQ